MAFVALVLEAVVNLTAILDLLFVVAAPSIYESFHMSLALILYVDVYGLYLLAWE